MKLGSRLTSPVPWITSLEWEPVSDGMGDGDGVVAEGAGVERIAAGEGAALGRMAALANTPASPSTTAIARSAASDRAGPPRLLRCRPRMDGGRLPHQGPSSFDIVADLADQVLRRVESDLVPEPLP